jgi:carboxyl-terminal processing protease
MRKQVLRVALCVTSLVAALDAKSVHAQAARPDAASTPMATPAALPIADLDTAWSAISRTYFDTVLVHGTWGAFRDSLRTSLGASPDLDAVRSAIRALIAYPGQSHFALIPANAVPLPSSPSTGGAPGTTGVDVRMIGDTLVVWRVQPGSVGALAGVGAGQIITHIDTIAVSDLRDRLGRAFPAGSREAQQMIAQVAMSRLGRSTGDTTTLTLVGADGTPRRAVLVHTPLAGTLTRYGNLPPLIVRTSRDSVPVTSASGPVTVPVIHFSAWFPTISTELDRHLFAVRGAPAVILDLRGNPGGAVGMIAGVAGHFSDTTWNLGTMYGRGSRLTLRANPRLVDATGTRQPVISAPLAILIDAFTASSSEFFAAGMQALGRAQVFGEPSAGQALPAAMLRLPSGDVLMHPIADHEDAGGRRVEGTGVVPDVITPLTRSELLAGRDVALDAARAWLARTLP